MVRNHHHCHLHLHLLYFRVPRGGAFVEDPDVFPDQLVGKSFLFPFISRILFLFLPEGSFDYYSQCVHSAADPINESF